MAALSPFSPIVQISLDLTSIPAALETAYMAIRVGVDWLEAETPLIVTEMNGVRALRASEDANRGRSEDDGWRPVEAELMAKARANLVVVMARFIANRRTDGVSGQGSWH